MKYCYGRFRQVEGREGNEHCCQFYCYPIFISLATVEEINVKNRGFFFFLLFINRKIIYI